MLIAFVIVTLVLTGIWLFSVRPYCRRHGKGYTPGANVGVTFWVDWQQAWEIAGSKEDRGMLRLCRLMLWLQLSSVALLLLLLVTAGSAQGPN